MRKILFAAAGLALAGASLTLTAPAHATANLPWCAEPQDMGFSQVCDFYTFEQCRAYVSGIGGTCAQNFQTHVVQPLSPGQERRMRRIEQRQRAGSYY